MKKIVLAAAVAAFALAGCDSSPQTEETAETGTVEEPANDVMTQPGMDEDPVVDPSAVDTVPEPEETDAPADQAADAAADAAADLQAAMNQ